MLYVVPNTQEQYKNPIADTESCSFNRDINLAFRGLGGSLLKHIFADSVLHYNNSSATDLWDYICNNTDYYVFRNDIKLLEKYNNDINTIIGENCNFIEFGPGTQSALLNKIIPLIENATNPLSYTPIDLSKKNLSTALLLIKRSFPFLRVNPIHDDFYNEKRVLRQTTKNIGLFLGGSIGNIAENDDALIPSNLIYKLSTLKRRIGDDGMLVFSHDTNSDTNSLIKAYGSYEMSMLFMNIFWRIKKEEKTKHYNPNNFEYFCTWSEKNKCLTAYARSRSNQKFCINDINYNMKEGEQILLGRSYKYTTKFLQEIAVAAGYKPLAVFEDKNNPMAIQIWKT